jgi:hypothetical protein
VNTFNLKSVSPSQSVLVRVLQRNRTKLAHMILETMKSNIQGGLVGRAMLQFSGYKVGRADFYMKPKGNLRHNTL